MSLGDRVRRELFLQKLSAEINSLNTKQRRKIRQRAAVARVLLSSGSVSATEILIELGLDSSAEQAVSGAVESLCARGWASERAAVVCLRNRRALIELVLAAEALGPVRSEWELQW